MIYVKFTKTVKLRTKEGERLYNQNEIQSFDEKVAEFLKQKGFCEVFHPEIKKQCFTPFQCELVEEDGSCIFIKKQILEACMGPYIQTPDGGIIAHQENLVKM